MKDFLDRMINRPFTRFGLDYNFQHEGKFVIIPDMLRRCKFLSSSEKEVLYELISWASTSSFYINGWCKVTEIQISNHTGLALSTVKKVVRDLAEKGFIIKIQDFDMRNKYHLITFDKNPWIILSEILYEIQSQADFYYNKSLIKNEDSRSDIGLFRKNWMRSVNEFSKNPEFYRGYIEKVNSLLVKQDDDDCNDIKEIIKEIKSEVHNILGEIFLTYFE